MTVHIHPSIDSGVKQGSAALARHPGLQMHGPAGQGRHQWRCRPQPSCGCTKCWSRRSDLLGGRG